MSRQIEPAKRRLLRRAPPRSFTMYPWQAGLRSFNKVREETSGRRRALSQNILNIIFYIRYIIKNENTLQL